ncbi:family 78 glycoside hydrolase catalytic domain [Kluyvera intermedia]|uniref:family 78 glycoside hydrolase catalytic domain n=1 Tax=Kluyvera intermedia TaxID=61648 RepID=UPI002432FAA6|nr:family 78 glycoside hydrolase catalytic domain [Kluyvera intermedia]WEJ85016.1 MAG: family 78 glycoside hydrolase catalytic domain [Kluyvera intermedia]
MLQLNYQVNHIIVDKLPIVCHWSVPHKQLSYSMTVSSGTSLIHEVSGIGDDTSLLIEGFNIDKNTRYHVELTSQGENGSIISVVNQFSTSNLGDFKGVWISAADSQPVQPDSAVEYRNNILRKQFDIQHDILESSVNIAGLGFYTLYINGQKVSGNELNTDWTNYSKTVYYDTYDLTDYLISGANEVVIELANGWFNPSPMKLFGKYNLRETLCTGENQALADITVKGRSETSYVSTDNTWVYCQGAYLRNNIYLGEAQDFRLFSGRNTTDMIAPRWHKVFLSKGPDGQLVSSFIPKIKKIKTVDFSHIHLVDENELVIDFGETVSGLLDLSVSASDGQQITLTYGENIADGYLLNTDSTLAGFIGKEVAPGVTINGGEESPRRAEQQDCLICRSGTNHYVNKYTYHSFRYVKISGMSLDQLNHVLVHSAHSNLESAGHFLCSDIFLNRLYEVARKTKLNNIHSVFSDCARERFAYGGDIVALAKSQVYQFDSARMYEKTILDFINDIRPNGGFPETAPFVGIKTNGTGDAAGPLGWQLVVPFLLNVHYQHYGTLDLARALIPWLERHIEHLNSMEFDALVKCCLGDWGSREAEVKDYKTGSPALHFTTACIYYLHYKLISKLCMVLGLNKKYQYYAKQTSAVKDKVIEKFKNSDGSFSDKSQTSYVFALYAELSDNPQILLKELIRKISNNNYAVTCGIFGQSFMYEIFRRYGENELILKWLHSQAGFKSMLGDGDTTLKEFFGDNKNGSCNHAMFSSYTSWMIQGPGGIIVDEDARGSDIIKIQPAFLDSLNFVECSHKTVRGNVYCKWQRLTQGIELVIKVPFNLKKCTVVLPEEYNVAGELMSSMQCDGLNQFYDITNAGDLRIFLTKTIH